MLNILVENNKGNYFYCYLNLLFSLDFFKKFIDESDFDSKQKEEYLLLYKQGLYEKKFAIIVFLLMLLSIIILIVLNRG